MMAGNNRLDWRSLNVPSTVDAERYAYQQQSTYAMLFADRVFLGEYESNDLGHAEKNLLTSAAWNRLIGALIASDTATDAPPYRQVTIVINRTPCHGIQGGCTGRLVNALLALRRNITAERFERVTFTLAATGIYEKGGNLIGRDEKGCSTVFDCYALMTAGWHLKALQVTDCQSSRGEILHSFIHGAEQRLSEPSATLEKLVAEYTDQGKAPRIKVSSPGIGRGRP